MIASWNMKFWRGVLVWNIMTFEQKYRLSNLRTEEVAAFIESSLPTTGSMEIVECKNLEKPPYTLDAFSLKALQFFYI